MTNHMTHDLAPKSERGMALVATLLLLLVMSGLALALTTSGRVEVAMGDNEELYAGARAAAESGLNRAVAQILAFANDPLYDLSNVLKGPDGLVNSADPGATENADNGFMTGPTFPDMNDNPPNCAANGSLKCWPVRAGSEYSYTVRLFDDDDAVLNDGEEFTAPELLAMCQGCSTPPTEDGTGVVDVNKRIVIRATGFGPRGTAVTIEQMLTPIEMPALLVDGDLLLDGSAKVLGTQGSVHSNENLTVDQVSVQVQGNTTSTGTLDTPPSWDPENPDAVESGGMPMIPVPNVRAQDYRSEADFVLRSDGSITSLDGTAVYCNTGQNCSNVTPPAVPPYTAPFGWSFSGGAWDLNENNVLPATYYAETDVKVTGNPGSASAATFLSIVAEGHIEIAGNPDLQPEPNSKIMFVTNRDLKINGNFATPLKAEGIILVREQIEFAGNPTLRGQVIVQDAQGAECVGGVCDTLIESNRVTGSVLITYDGYVEAVAYTVSGWRETQ